VVALPVAVVAVATMAVAAVAVARMAVAADQPWCHPVAVQLPVSSPATDKWL